MHGWARREGLIVNGWVRSEGLIVNGWRLIYYEMNGGGGGGGGCEYKELTPAYPCG